MSSQEQFAIDQERLAEVLARKLSVGSHREACDNGFTGCFMEGEAYIHHRPWTDSDETASPIISAFLRSWNDAIKDDDTRTDLLKGFLGRVIGSRGTTEVEDRRAAMALDWLVRVSTASAADFGPAEVKPFAAQLRALPPLLTPEAFESARPILLAAQNAAWAAWAARAARAAWADWADWAARAARAAWAARDAWDARADWAARAARAAWDDWAARDAIRSVAGLDEALAAGKNAAVSCADAYDAAYQACAALFAPALDTLERSALDLIDRMLECQPHSL